MDAPSSIDTDAHQYNAWLVHCQTDGIRRAIACVPTPALARFGKAIRRCFYRMERVQPINLKSKYKLQRLLQNYVELINKPDEDFLSFPANITKQ